MRHLLVGFFLVFFAGEASAVDLSSAIIGIGNDVDGDGKVVFILRYHTYLPMNDAAALRMEADEFWQYIYPDALRSRDVRARLTAVGHVAGEHQDRTVDFVFNRRGYGVWHTQEPEDRTKIDEAFVRAFFERFDVDAQRKLTDALLLYIAPEWVQKMKSKASNFQVRSEFERGELAEVLQGIDYAQGYKHERRILSILLGEDQRSARVESRQTDSGDALGIHEELVTHTTDFLELRGRFALITKTFKVVEKYERSASE